MGKDLFRAVLKKNYVIRRIVAEITPEKRTTEQTYLFIILPAWKYLILKKVLEIVLERVSDQVMHDCKTVARLYPRLDFSAWFSIDLVSILGKNR